MRDFLFSVATCRRWLVAVLLLAGAAPAYAGNPQLNIVGTTAGDNTAFIDNVEVVNAVTGLPVSGAVLNPSFESYTGTWTNSGASVNPGGTGNYGYYPNTLVPNWTLTGGTGIAQNGSAFGPPPTSYGTAVGFLQGPSVSFVQVLPTLPTGRYYLRVQVGQRGGNTQNLDFYIDGVVVGSIQPASGTNATFTSAVFVVDPPAVSSFSPTRNFLAAALATNVVVNFSQPIDNATASNIKVYSAQAGGKKAGAYSTSSSTVTFNPTTNFKPGETVFATIPTTVQSTGGATTTNKQVYQFTTAVGGTGIGNFQVASFPPIGFGAYIMATGDIDGDGDLDLLAANGSTVSISLNNGSGTFTSSTAAAVGAGAYGLAVGDLDGDGDLDLVTASNTTASLSVRMNNGTGSFSGSQQVAITDRSFGVVLGDVDGDGDLDLLAANFNAVGTVAVRLNDGNGNFSGSQNVSVGNTCFSLAVGDVDGDGDLDLLVPSYNASTVGIRLNDGNGNFSGSQNVSVGTNPSSIAVGDVDADGDLDLLTGNVGTNTVSVRTNNGSGLFGGSQNVTVNPSPQGVTLGDVDNDGDLDLATANFNISPNGTASVRFNNGSGTFSGGQNLAQGGDRYSPLFSDVDGDGDLDLLTTNHNSSTVTVTLNQGLSTISSFSPTSGAAGTSITLNGTNLSGTTSVSVNGVAVTPTSVTSTSLVFVVPAGASTTQSIALTNSGGPGVASTAFTVLLNVASANPAANALAAPLPGSATAVTFTEPVTSASAANLKVFSAQAGGRKAGTVTVAGSTASFAATASTAVTPFRPGETVSVSVPATVLGAGGLATTAAVYQFTTATTAGAGTFAAKTDYAAAFSFGVALGDLNADGLLDMVTTNYGPIGSASGTSVWVLLGTGAGSFGAATAYPCGTGPDAVAIGDVNNDGKLDVVTGNYTTSNASVLLGTGTGTLGAATGFTTGSLAYNVALGDVNGDANLDLVVANGGASTVSVLLGNGAGSFGAKTDFATGAFPIGLALGDVNGDGRLDIATANNSGGNASVLLGTGAGGFGAKTDYATGAGANCVALGDLNADGKLDMVVGNSTPNTASVLLGTGSGTFGAVTNFPIGSNVRSLALGDVNGDGAFDFVTANYGAGTTSVLLGTGAGSFAAKTDYATGTNPTGVALGDVNNDGRLDIATGNNGAGTASVLLGKPFTPTISSISPTPGVRGQAVTVTGTNLGSVTSVSVNGVAANAASFVNNTATSLTFRVPATAGTSGTTSVTTAGGTASTATFTTVAATPPGNALAFDGVDDYVALPSGLNTASFTFEAWVNYQPNGDWTRIFDFGTTTNNWMLLGPRAGVGYTAGAVGNIFFSLKKNLVSDQTILTSTPMPTGRWSHVAVTLATTGTTTVGTIYLDGVAIGTNAAMTLDPTVLGTLTYSWLGRSANGDPYLKASLDEVRVYNTALTQTQVQADMLSTNTAAGLVAYFNFDQAANTPGGTNTGQTTLYDQSSNAYAGTLTNFALTGTASNYVESYALVVPTATAASPIAGTSFTANWTAPAFGTVDNGYRVDVSTSSTFASVISGSPFTAASGTSLSITGLANSTTYYYRVRAEKTSVTGQGGNSNVISLTTLPLPTITSFSPTSGVAGTSINLTGTGLTGATSVSVNGVAVTPTGVSGTSLTFVVPAGASATQSITVTSPNGTSAASTAFTVLLRVASTSPVANARTAALANSATAVTFTEPVTAASAASLKVFSAQLGGLKAGTVTAAGSTASFAATASTVRTNFKPGETVGVTVPATVLGAGGLASAKRVYQFTTVVGGLGRGNFLPGSNVALGYSTSVATGDVNGDGYLDVLTTGSSAVNVQLNNGSGTFSSGGSYPVGNCNFSQELALGDLDNDGDLDFVVVNEGSGVVTVRLNNGTGTFGGGGNVVVGSSPYCLALGDIDGDGDLDLLTGNAGGLSISTRFNDGTGTFSGSTDLGTGGHRLAGLSLGDLDGDGDLDVAGGSYAGAILIRLNDGAGTFSGSTNLSVAQAYGVALGDIDGDGDLDVVAASGGGTNAPIYVRLNNGNATFTSAPDLTAGSQPYGVTLGDVDADGDLDLVAANRASSTLNLFLNNGPGTFASGGTVTAGYSAYSAALADFDDDGDLDMVTGGFGMSVRFNQPPAPTITSFSPNPAGAGIPVTLTGTTLSGATSLSINGAAATILTNTGTAITFRVPAGATATGTSSVTTPNGTGTSPAFIRLLPPGNALAFDGVDDEVRTAAAPTFGTGDFTVETWVRTSTASTSPFVAVGSVGGNDYWLGMVNGNATISVSGGGCVGTSLINDGHWHHLAGVRSGTSLTIYVDGIAQTTVANGNGASPTAPLGIGSFGNGSYFWPGSLDEVRLWNVARTPAQLLAALTTPLVGAETNLVGYYSFDEGTPNGTNAGLTTLYDLTSTASHGTLLTSALTGSTSNWVESYALVVPTATAATTPSASSFTANWTAPATGTVTNYLLDVSTAANFSSAVSGSPFTVAAPTLTKAVTGLAASTPYYYRVRADKTSVTGQGDYSNAITVATCAPPVAIAQNTGVTLDVNGNATLTAAAVNNGSTANCGPAAAGALSVSPSSFSCADAVPATVASALSFNGSGQYVTVAPGNSLPIGNSSYTLEAWIKPASMGIYGIVGYGTYGIGPQVNAFRLSPNNGGELINYWWGPDLIVPTGNLADGQWHHVAATYDGTTRIIYVDGVVKGSDVPGVAHAVPNANNVTIAKTAGTEYFRGSMDEVRIWSVARTAAQLSTTKGIGLPGGSAGLVAYYRFNEGSGTTVSDATGMAANLGTFVGSPTWTTDAPSVTNGLPVTLTVTDAGGNTATTPAVVSVSVPATPTTTWNGSLSISPLACQNWSYGKVPDVATNAVIPTGQPTYPTLTTGTLPTKDLTINTGGSLTTNGGTTLQVNGNLANNGTATLSGPVQFVGSAATQTLGGSTSTPFTTLEVNKASGTVQLAQNLTINAALTLTSGTLTTTGSYQVNLGGSATISESDASYVLGKVVVNRTLSAGTAEPFAGLGLTLTPAAASTAPGATLVTRITGTAIAGAGTSQSILRSFDIQPAVNTGLNVTMDFAYLTHELNGIAAGNLAMFKSVSGGTPWIPQRGTTAAGNVLTKTGISDFSIWTLGNSANPLPVELTAFTATALGRTVQLKWSTASEKNTARFEVERSLDGTAFDRIGTVAAAGTSTAPQAYALTDAQLPASTRTLYYRLKQVDQDGTFSFSPVRRVGLSEAAEGLALYPNPTHGSSATLTGSQPGTLVHVFDALGRVVTSATADATGTAALALPAGLATGVYVVRTGNKALRLTVE